MANLGGLFNAEAVQPSEDFSPVPAGDYMVIISDSEMKSTKAGNGSYLELSLEIIDGQFKGRKVWDRLNINNPNEKAVEIAQRTLSAICHATGVMQVSDSSQLHGKPMVAVVSVNPGSGQYGPSNEVKTYKKAGHAAPAAQAAPQSSPAQASAFTPAAQPAAAANVDVPW